MPTYRPNEEYLRAAIDSVFAQTETDWQLFVSDEPTDVNTEEMIPKNEKINFKRHMYPLGIGKNWNTCLQFGDSPYVQFLFQDDTWDSRYLERAIEILDNNPDIGFVSLGHEYKYEGKIPTKNTYKELQDYLTYNVSEGRHSGNEFLLKWMENGLHPNVIGEPSFVMMRREVMQQVGEFRTDMSQNLDSEYWTRMLAKTNWFYLPGNFGTFRVHADSASMRNFESGAGIFDRFRMLKSATALLPENRRRQAKEIQKKHTRKMVEKFVKRYGNEHIHLNEQQSISKFVLRHPLLMLRCLQNFGSRQKR